MPRRRALMRTRDRHKIPGLLTSLRGAFGKSALAKKPARARRAKRASATQRGRVVRRVRRIAPGLVAQELGLVLLSTASDRHVAIGAFQRFLRQLDVLHQAGYRHLNISPKTVGIDTFGELRLTSWKRAGRGAAAADYRGIKSVRLFLQKHYLSGG